MTAARTISEILADLGVSHQADPRAPYGCRALFFAGRFIGFYDAREVCELLAEHGLSDWRN